jgi:RNA polymerase sigma factor (sigma-70 family)
VRSKWVNPSIAKKPTTSAQSLEATIRAYDRELHWFLVNQLRGRKESPEDIRQEIYLRMLRFTDAELVREPRAYLYRVARNVLNDKLLLAQRELATFEPSASEGIAPDETAQADSARDLNRILSQLPPLYRAVLQLRATERLSYSEIAEELGISVHTVKKYMHLALVQCRSISLGLK